MPIYDRKCQACGHVTYDRYELINTDAPVCDCGGLTERVWLGKSNSIIADEIPGGVLIQHGICWDDGSPRRYTSKSEMARVAKEKGLTNLVRHVGSNGTDKSRHTVRWV